MSKSMIGKVVPETEMPDMCDPFETVSWEFRTEHFDDTSGEPLDERLVQEACA